MIKSFFYKFLNLLLIVLPALTFAAQQNPGLGDYAQSLMQPVGVLNNFISSGAIIIGVACLFAAFFRYNLYRINPLASPISTVILLLVLGLVMIGLPFLYLLTGGVPFTLHRR